MKGVRDKQWGQGVGSSSGSGPGFLFLWGQVRGGLLSQGVLAADGLPTLFIPQHLIVHFGNVAGQ